MSPNIVHLAKLLSGQSEEAQVPDFEQVFSDPFFNTDLLQYGPESTAARKGIPVAEIYRKYPHLRKRLGNPASNQRPEPEKPSGYQQLLNALGGN